MSEQITIRAFDVAGPFCVATDDGQALHDKAAPLMREGRKVLISFAGVETVISAFLNAAIGQLYGEFREDRIRDLLDVRDMTAEDRALLKRVVENAKRYFENREQFDQAWQEEVGDEE